MLLPSAVLAAGDSSAATCPFETEASAGFRTYLPDCRAYELVTPPYKEGGEVALGGPAAISPDGAHVITGVGGAFAGAGNYWWQDNRNPDFDAYEFTRTEAGWTPSVLTPPATQFPHSALMAADGNSLGTTLWGAATNTLTLNEDIYVRETNGEFSLVGPGSGPEVRHENLDFPGDELNFAGASRDLTHSLFTVTAFSGGEREGHGGHGNLWQGDTTKEESPSLYEYFYQERPNAEPTLVGVSNEGKLKSNAEAVLVSKCGVELGSGYRDSAYNAVSQDGETVFFTADAAPACSGPGEPTVNELYARVGQSKTVAISEPSLPAGECTSPEPCSTATPKEAIFQGASENGERVFFLSEQPLVNGAPSAGLKLYEAHVAGGKVAEIVDVSSDPMAGQSPEVQGVARVSENGERVYFVAKSKLAPKNAEEKEPEEGAYNLYVYDTGAKDAAFVATLLTVAEESSIKAAEEVEKSRIEELALERYLAQTEAAQHRFERGEISEEEKLAIEHQAEASYNAFIREELGTLGPSGTLSEDKGVWQPADERPAQATPNGQYLVFPSSADLTPDDHSRLVPQLFEYDASIEKLSRVSIGEHGTYGNDGNVGTFREAPQIGALNFSRDWPTGADGSLALSGDGQRVFFTSGARLTPEVEDRGSPNVYEYEGGDVYLISDGRDSSVTAERPTVKLFGIDSSGQDAFFLTADALAPQAAPTQVALYDARQEGGFPAPTSALGCSGETCRGASGAPPQLQLPGTTDQLGGDNLPPAVESKTAAKPQPKPLTRSEKLARALKACKKKSKRLRPSCERQAKKSYGKVKASGKNANRSGK